MTERFWAGGTGIGSLPGTDVEEALRTVVGELPWPHLPELPDRGPGADMVGRAASLLVEMPVETSVDGWRLTGRPGQDLRRAKGLLARDLDAVEEQLVGFTGPFKVQMAGPLTLAASLELRTGHRLVRDPGARQDLGASLAEGLGEWVGQLRRRVPGCVLTVQLDEPSLPAALAGAVSTPSGLGHERAVPAAEAADLLARVVAGATGSGAAAVAVHCCAATAPVALVAGLDVAALSLDLALVPDGGDDALAGWLDSGRVLVAGVVPGAGQVPEPAEVAEQVRRLARRLGFGSAEGLSRVVVAPACGLAGVSSVAARTVMATVREAARLLADDPEGEGS